MPPVILTPPSSALQLDLENKLIAFLTGAIDKPPTFFAAHDVTKRAPANVDYIAIIAGIPDWSAAQGEAAEVQVTFQIVSNVADSTARSDKKSEHQRLLGLILDLFDYPNASATLETLNNEMGDRVGVDGFEMMSGASEDGRSTDEKALAPKLEYVFEVFGRLG